MSSNSSNTSTDGMSTATAVNHAEVFRNAVGSLFDFHEMASVDWDEVHDGNKLTPREYTAWNALNIIRLSVSTWILASHVAIIVFILAKRVLRSQPKNLLIVNVALTNLLMGVFVVPVKLHFILNPHELQCDLAVGWTFIANYLQTSVALFAVLSLVLERFVYVYTENNQKYVLPLTAIIGTLLLFIAPWILSSLFLLPTFYAGLIAESKDPNDCYYKVDDNYFVAAQLISFIPASLGVFVLAPFTGLLDCLRPNSCLYSPLTPKLESMTVTAFVSLFSVFSEAPFCIVQVLMMRLECNHPYCSRFSEALSMTMWVRVCKAAIFPFIWLAYTDIRKAMLCDVSIGKPDEDHNSDDEENEMTGDVRRYPIASGSS